MNEALLIIPLPCDVRFFCQMIDTVARSWEAAHPGQTMTTAHLETREDADGKTLIVWDQPSPESGTSAPPVWPQDRATDVTWGTSE